VTTYPYRDLAVKEEVLKKQQAVIKETKHAPSVATIETTTLTESKYALLPRTFLKSPLVILKST